MAQNYKSFPLDSKENFIIYLRFLIENTQIHRKQYKRYLDDMKDTIYDMGLLENPNKKIEPNIYFDFRNIISRPQNMLLNIIGDGSTTGASYRKFRIMAKRKMTKNNLDLGLTELSPEIWDILVKVNNCRNWSLHIPESLITAVEEVDKVTKEKENVTFNRTNNPIRHTVFDYYEANWIISLYTDSFSYYQDILKIFQQMKKDYSQLIGESMKMENIYFDIRSIEDMNIPKISFQIQDGKYDGKPEGVWTGFVDIKPINK